MSVHADLALGDVNSVPPEPLAQPAELPPSSQDAATAGLAAAADVPDRDQHVQLRALINSPDASVIIGKGGSHINEIRAASGAALHISPSVPKTSERILTVSGALDAVSRAFGLLVRRIFDEPFDVPSYPGTQPYPARLIIPNSRMGSVIGKGGSKIKEIQEASGARLQAADGLLPGSTERLLTISGVADAVHIAVYFVAAALAERPERNNLQYRPGASATAASFSTPVYPGAGAAPFGAVAGGAPRSGVPPGQPGAESQTQQIHIPNDLVGSIIGRAGSKINEIRSTSGTHIKIIDPDTANASERLVTITGPPQNIQVAIHLLNQRVEDEQRRVQNAQV